MFTPLRVASSRSIFDFARSPAFVATVLCTGLSLVTACSKGERENMQGDSDSDSGIGDSDSKDSDGDDDSKNNSEDDSEDDDTPTNDSDFPTFNPDTEVEFSYIWIANSKDGSGTVSKVNTRTKKEEARYFTGPELWSNPSRTSVNLNGDVAVVNRSEPGGSPSSVTMIRVRTDECEDVNKDGMIRTSTGPMDILPWGQDDCVVWNQQLDVNARPVAWTSGRRLDDPDSNVPKFVDAEVWVSAPTLSQQNAVKVSLLRGDNGSEIDHVIIPGIAIPRYGIYGAAVDSNNDLWGIPLAIGTPSRGEAKLVHVSHENIKDYELIDIPNGQGYGMTVDPNDRVWVGCDSELEPGGLLQRYDPETKSWDKVDLSNYKDTHLWWIRGMSVDTNLELWAAVVLQPTQDGPGGGILRIDAETMEAIEFLDRSVFPEVRQPTGVSVDVDGLVWMVDELARVTGGAFVFDPEDRSVDFVGGLVNPYTYSDMTGAALRNVQPDNPK